MKLKEKVKKRFEIFKINNEIRRVNRELMDAMYIGPSSISGYIYQAPMQPAIQHRAPESERAVLLRQSLNGLINKREEIRTGK